MTDPSSTKPGLFQRINERANRAFAKNPGAFVSVITGLGQILPDLLQDDPVTRGMKDPLLLVFRRSQATQERCAQCGDQEARPSASSAPDDGLEARLQHKIEVVLAAIAAVEAERDAAQQAQFQASQQFDNATNRIADLRLVLVQAESRLRDLRQGA